MSDPAPMPAMQPWLDRSMRRERPTSLTDVPAPAEGVRGGRMSGRPTLLPEDRYFVGRIAHSRSRSGQRMSVWRTRVSKQNPELALTFGSVEASIARCNLIPVPATEMWTRGGLISLPPRSAADASLRNVVEPITWPMLHAIDQIAFELPRAAVANWAEDHAVAREILADTLSGSVVADRTLKSFALAILPNLNDEMPGDQFFVDHILDGVCAYMLQTFSTGRSPRKGGLASWQERRVKEMMDAGRGDDLSLADLAEACGLSVAHFSRAFRQSCGASPHRWLTQRRIERAKELMRTSDMSLAGIAVECGFSDQSHFTNTFSRYFGSPPGVLRRYWRNGG